jgi:hypothetical protein
MIHRDLVISSHFRELVIPVSKIHFPMHHLITKKEITMLTPQINSEEAKKNMKNGGFKDEDAPGGKKNSNKKPMGSKASMNKGMSKKGKC